VQKREQEIAAAEALQSAPAAAPAVAAEAAAAKGVFKSKEQRRQEAEARNRRGKMKTELKRELPVIELEIAVLERLKTRNQLLLCDPEVLRDSKRIKPLMLELSKAQPRLVVLYRRWEELTSELEKIDKMDF
jgi:ATP-binding cassette subfamily F protein 3